MIDYYIRLLQDRSRVKKFRQAIEEQVNAGSVVADIGAGIGTFSMFAARAGARRVYAIEKGPVSSILPAIIRDNGLASRIEVIQATAARAGLAEKVDLLITEDFTHLFLNSDLREIVMNPRSSLLKRGGRIIPQKVRVYFAPVDLGKSLTDFYPWHEKGFGYDLNLNRVQEMSGGLHFALKLSPSQLLAEPVLHSELDLLRLDEDWFQKEFVFHLSRPGRLSGIAGWFEAQLSSRIQLSNRPGSAGLVWRQGILPVDAREVQEGDRLEVEISLLRDPWSNPFWRWQGELSKGSGRVDTFDRSTFQSLYLDRNRIDHFSKEYTPADTTRLKAGRLILNLLGTGMTLGEVAERLEQTYPRLFPASGDAARTVHDLTENFL